MGRRTSFVAWISVPAGDDENGVHHVRRQCQRQTDAPATNTGSSHTFDTSTCCNPSRAFFGVTFFSADEPASATLVSVFFLVAASPCGCVCVDGFSLAIVSLLDFHWVCAQAEIQRRSSLRDATCFARYCSYASITLISQGSGRSRLSVFGTPCTSTRPIITPPSNRNRKKYGMRVRCMGTHAVFLFEKLPTLICDA